MSDINQRKQKFLEMLMTLGSLLAIFLGFVVEKTGTLLNFLVGFGVVFIVSALVAYSAGLFPEKVQGSFATFGLSISRAVLAVSFAGLVTIGVAYAASLTDFGNVSEFWRALGVVILILAIFLGSFFLVYTIILRVMNLEPD